ncbi:MAG: DUF1592 domain-containing protein [Planctomycetota bacterium]|nr:DUF1592 domain-containing protein [Planctomycetota bacterium]
MSRFPIVFQSPVVMLMLRFLVFAPAIGALAQDREAELKQYVLPLLREHCLDCHSGAEPDAGLTLDHYDAPIDFLKGRDVWEHAAQKIQIKEMPPPDSSDLSAKDRKYLVDWIRSVIDEFECGLEPNPGKVTLRRLNASEYSNTIRDLFGLKSYRPATAFAGDDVGYGFDNIGDVLTLPPLLMEKYYLEAERISTTLIQVPPREKVFTVGYAGGQLESKSNSKNANRELTLTSAGAGSFRVQIPKAGPYILTVSADGDQAGNEPCMMGVEIDGKLQRQKIRVPNESPLDFSTVLRLRAGSRTIGVRFLNDFYQAGGNGKPKLDRNLRIHHVQLEGKKKPPQRLPDSQLSSYHKRILFTYPETDDDRERASKEVLNRIASFAFRRPVSNHDLDRLVALALSIQEEGDSFEESIQIALQAILISPKFLFRVEPPQAGVATGDFRDLDDFELATRLSYFLWSSMPDPQLFQLAASGKLSEGSNIEQQIARMIQDPRSNEFVRNFAGQWLTLRKLDDFQPDPATFPKWNESMSKLTRNETMFFFAGVMRKNMSVLNLLDAKFTYLNEELAGFYGIEGVSGEQFRPVSLEGTNRGGILTQASVLAVTSNPTRTSPVKRGKWILENLLAKPPPPAPPGVPELEEKKGELTGTLRERLEQHRSNPACANCHKLMDPLGFALENFDGIGQYRTQDGTHRIDATGEMPDGTQVRGVKQLQKLLLERHKRDFVECLTEKMMTYALGRGLEYYDKCAVDKIVARLENENYRFSALLFGIVRSDPFQKKGERENP